MKTAILLSGGIDSIALSYWLRPELAITVSYGQAAADAEIQSSIEVCRSLAIKHEIVRVDCSSIGTGNMTSPNFSLQNEFGSTPKPSPEWWPFRNQLLVSLAAGTCLRNQCNELIIGTVKSDGLHKDGTLEFVERLCELTSCQEGGLTVRAPAIGLSTFELVTKSQTPTSVLGWSHSCHRQNTPCGSCRGCAKHREVFWQIQKKETLPDRQGSESLPDA